MIGKLVAGNQCLPVGIEGAVISRPFVRSLHFQPAPHHLHAPGVRQEQFALRTEDDDARVHALENGFQELRLFAQFADRSLQFGLGFLFPGHVAKEDNGAFDVRPVIAPKCAARDIDVCPFRPAIIAHEHFLVDYRLALQGAHQRRLVGGEVGFLVELEEAVFLLSSGRVIQFTRPDVFNRPDNSLGRRVGEQDAAVPVDGDDAVPQCC